MQELQELLSKNLSFIEATGRNLEECRAVSDKAREAHDNYDRDRVMLAFDNLDDMEDYQFSLQRATSALIKTLRDAHAQRNVECALSAKNNPSKLDETWNTQPTSFFVKKEKMNDNNSKSTERQEHIGKMERRIYGTDMADIAVQRANIRKFIATLEDETIRVHQPIVPAVPNTIVPTPSPVVPASVPTVVPSTNIGALFKAVATSNESKEVVKPVVVDSHPKPLPVSAITAAVATTSSTVAPSIFGTSPTATVVTSVTSTATATPSSFTFKPAQTTAGTTASSVSFTPQQPATEVKPVFGEFGTQKSSSLFGGSSAAGAPSATSASTVAKPVVVDSHPKPLPVSAITAAVATTSSTVAPSIFGTSPTATVVTSVTSTATATPSSFTFKPAQTTAGTTASSVSFTPQQPATEVKPVFGEFGTQKSSSLFGGSSAAGAPSATSASTVAKPVVVDSHPKPLPVSATTAAVATTSSTAAPSIFGTPPTATVVTSVTSTATATPSSFTFKPAQTTAGTTASSFSFTPQQPATEAKPVFGECGTQKSSSLFGGSSAAGAPSATSASTVAFSFSKPVESKPSVFGKPAESAPVNVVSSTDEGMMEDDSPADFASGAKSGSLFSSSGFLSGLGSAAPKGEVKNVFGGAINKPGTVANASSWLFAKSGSSPQHSQQTVQPSSFSFKSSNAGTSSTFGKAAFGGGASPFSGGSSFGTASFGGKPAFGASVAPATDAGFASFASAGSGGGFAKFAQQGSNGFGAAPTGSTFGGSSMAFTPSSTFGGGNTSSFSNQIVVYELALIVE
ncbi:hypothetical protein QR680_012080 [Steinernema hermaphroditum]|uniref:Uncharacterized protein n=1 Tax=Steinernema hermaphroditum TaxID=289476 RepID=A0AA39I0U1_9BILA|nr:hypothetical protein QR680_012080 [Steinernema hermaphroditum]